MSASDVVPVASSPHPHYISQEREHPVLQILFYTRASLISRWYPYDLNASLWVLLPSSVELRITFSTHEFGWKTCLKHRIWFSSYKKSILYELREDRHSDFLGNQIPIAAVFCWFSTHFCYVLTDY